MKVKTKFSIGDQVYCIRGNNILPYTVESIDINISNVHRFLVEELYGLKPLLPSADKAAIPGKMFGNYIFKTKAEVMRQLFYVINHPGNKKALEGTKFIKKE